MLRLRAYVSPERVEALGARLASLSGVRHLVLGGQTFNGMTELTGDVETDAADTVLEVLRDAEMDSENVTLSRSESVQPIGWGRRQGLPERDALVWAEVLGRARAHARPGLVYLLYMVASGVIAGVGVLTGSSILIVGAMALSPDLLPISATAVGLVERRHRLWRRAVLTLVLGLGVVVVAAAFATLLLRVTDRIPQELNLAHTVLAFPVIVGFSWARFAGIAVAGLDLLLEFAFLAHYPLWSLIIVLLNVLVIYGLAVRGGEPTELDQILSG